MNELCQGQESLSRKIVRNTAYNIAGRLCGIIVMLFLTPYIISRIGMERFGIWSIVGVITGYFGLLDFGVGTSFVKYIAEFYAKREFEKINQVINSGIIFYLIFSIISIILALIFINPVIALFKIPLYLRQEMLFVFVLGIILFSLSNTLGPFGAIQSGLQRMDISTKVGIAVSAFNAAGAVFFLEKGYGLPGLMINNALSFIINSILNILIAFKILPELRLNLFFLNKKMLASLFRFGYKLQVSRFANLISFQSDKLFITYFLNISFVAFYQLGYSIVSQARQIPLLLVSALVPAVSEMEAKQGKGPLKELYLQGSKYLIFISVPLLFFMIANASFIMLIWMGKGYGLAVLVIRILAVGYFAATVTGVASAIAAGTAKTELDMKFGIVMACLNIALNTFFVIKLGFIGVVIGTTSSLTFASIYYFMMFHGYLGYSINDFVRLLYKPLAVCIAPTLAVLFFYHNFFNILECYNRILNLFILGVISIIFLAIYLVFIRASRYFNETDKSFFKEKIPFMKFLLLS